MMADASSNFVPRRVLVVEGDPLAPTAMRTQLQTLGHQVVGAASNSADALRLFREFQPEIVLLEARINGTDGIELAAQLLKERYCPIVVVSAFSDAGLVERASAAGVFGYLIKPVGGAALQAQMEIAFHRSLEYQRVLQEKDELARALEDRKVVERAKGIFMRRLNLTEPEAHRRLQQESQKRRIGLAELAKRIIESEELLGGPEQSSGGGAPA